jgi:hypothetical protein
MSEDMPQPFITAQDFARQADPHFIAVCEAAQKMGARISDIPGLWFLPGYPELTSAQLLQLASAQPRK